MSNIQSQLNIPDGIIETIQEEALLSLLKTTEMVLQHARRTLFTDQLSQAQFNILMILSHEPVKGISQKEISKRLITTKGNTSQHIARLEDVGFLKRKYSNKDRRYNTITISAKGKRVLDAVEPHYREQISEIFHPLNKMEIVAFINSTNKLRHQLVRINNIKGESIND